MHLIPMVGGPFDGLRKSFDKALPTVVMNWMKPDPVTTLDPYRYIPPRPCQRVEAHTYVLRWLSDGSMYYEHAGSKDTY